MIRSEKTKRNSRTRSLMLMVMALIAVLTAQQTRADDDEASNQEYRVKAAFLYNFLKFVDWPKEKDANDNDPITIGVIGKDPFAKSFDPIKDKPVKNKKVVIKRFKSIAELKKLGETANPQINKQIEAAKKCQLLFICRSEKDALEDIFKAVKNQPILTVGDTDEFIKTGGIINFVTDEQKVRFEVSTAAANHAKLKIRSQLLRLAKRVIEKENEKE
ncbi:MAG: YfiR family protein [Sedimentisphaerales bacterium]|nr:YfiR family protein [Sedimentisphaerales bacterium]